MSATRDSTVLDALEVFDAPVDLLNYRRDCSVARPGQPLLAVRAHSVDDVQRAIAYAVEAGLPLYTRGGGTMYAGGANPQAGGVVLDLGAMHGVLELDLARGVVVVEPGVRFADLLARLAPHGVTIGVVPSTGPAATVGGAVSAHALGTGSPRHQSMGDCVAGLEVVLADGTRLRTGSAACREAGFFQRYCIGPDLTGLFIGADGTFGVITAVCLWLYPLPAVRSTLCLGFADARAAGDFASALQARELTRNVWYAAGYEGSAVRARVRAAHPDYDQAALPGFCLGFELGASASAVAADAHELSHLAEAHGGRPCTVFDEVYFRTLRFDQNYWYSFAGYFARSRCAILMSSLPCDRLAAFCAVVEGQRARHAAFVWAAASVLCRRGLHGGVLAFYDERSEWDAMLAATADCAEALIAAGCVPYKSGKLWATQVQACSGYSHLLDLIKRGVDPRGVFAPGNLGL